MAGGQGGARPGAGRPKLPPELKRKKTSIWVSEEEWILVKGFLAGLREKKRGAAHKAGAHSAGSKKGAK